MGVCCMKKTLQLFSLFVLTVVIFFTVKAGSAQAEFTNYITRSGDRFMDGTETFRFVGSNVPFLARAWTDPAEIEDAIKAAGMSGMNVVRLYPFEVRMSSDPPGTFRHVTGPGDFNESAFKLFDKILLTANQYNVRLIVPFVDRYNYVGGTADWAAFRGKSESEFYTDPVVKQDFKNFIAYVINRTNTYTNVPYKNDKAIMAWQLGNELFSTDSWTSEMAAYVKSLDPNHLVGDGGYVRAQGIRANALTDSNIDFIDPHIYTYHNVDTMAKLSEWRAATLGKKPLIIGEFGDYTAAETEAMLQLMQSNGTAGALFWGAMPHHRLGGWHWPPLNGWGYMRYPGFPSGDWAEESEISELLRRYNYSVNNEEVPAWPVPDAPVLFPADSVRAISWKGVPIAKSYEVERAEAAAGPWAIVGRGITDDVSVPRFHTSSVPLFDDSSAQAGTNYYYRIRAINADGVYSAYSNVIGPIRAKEATVLDNGGSGYTETGTWGDSVLPGSFDGSSRYSSTNGSTATWRLEAPEPGYYNVYVRYPYHQTSTLTASYTIVHNGLTSAITIDQTTIAGGWRLLDTVYLAGNGTEYVRLWVAGGGNHRADAVMLEPALAGGGFQNGSSSYWTALSGDWAVADDLSKVLKQSCGCIAETRGAEPFANVSVTAAVKAYDAGPSEASTGLIARATADLSSMYTLRINYSQSKLQLYKKLGHSWTKIGQADMTAVPGSWQLLRFELKGDSLAGYLNGVRKISVRDSSLQQGYIGLRTYAQTAVFDQIVVSPM